MLTCRSREALSYTTKNGKKPFEIWLGKLKDVVGKAKILARIERAGAGNFGNYRELGEGLCEIKEPFGPGYRLYFAIDHDEIILLLIGGDKGSQRTDIEKAKAYWNEYKTR